MIIRECHPRNKVPKRRLAWEKRPRDFFVPRAQDAYWASFSYFSGFPHFWIPSVYAGWKAVYRARWRKTSFSIDPPIQSKQSRVHSRQKTHWSIFCPSFSSTLSAREGQQRTRVRTGSYRMGHVMMRFLCSRKRDRIEKVLMFEFPNDSLAFHIPSVWTCQIPIGSLERVMGWAFGLSCETPPPFSCILLLCTPENTIYEPIQEQPTFDQKKHSRHPVASMSLQLKRKTLVMPFFFVEQEKVPPKKKHILWFYPIFFFFQPKRRGMCSSPDVNKSRGPLGDLASCLRCVTARWKSPFSLGAHDQTLWFSQAKRLWFSTGGSVFDRAASFAHAGSSWTESTGLNGHGHRAYLECIQRVGKGMRLRWG